MKIGHRTVLMLPDRDADLGICGPDDRASRVTILHADGSALGGEAGSGCGNVRLFAAAQRRVVPVERKTNPLTYQRKE